MRHKFEPSGGIKENPGVWDTGHGGLRYVDQCACGVRRERGKDYTSSRPSNNWGPIYFDAAGNRISKAGACQRKEHQR